jgi:hypothetical protein
MKAPHGQLRPAAISVTAAKRLAYYKSQYGPGVLAPRGWHCFGMYGSNGSTLLITPEPISSARLFSRNSEGITGPAIQISLSNGDTSGRFSVAKIIARVFPTHKDFVEAVITEGIEPASSFPFGPYPGDTLNYRSNEVVEFKTPAMTEGLGTASRLSSDSSPISGVAILFGEEPNLVHLSLRLPPNDDDLSQVIIRQTERKSVEFR